MIGRSFRHRVEKVRSKILHCETPERTGSRSDLLLLTDVSCCRLVRYA